MRSSAMTKPILIASRPNQNDETVNPGVLSGVITVISRVSCGGTHCGRAAAREERATARAVPPVVHMTRPNFDAGAEPRPDFLKKLRKEARLYQQAGITEQVMLSFTPDPYHPDHPTGTTLTRHTLEVLIEHGMGVCVLSKGGTRALRDIDLFRPDRDAFAATLTSLDDAFP